MPMVSEQELAAAWAEVVHHDRFRFEVPDPIGFADGGPDGSTWRGGPSDGVLARADVRDCCGSIGPDLVEWSVRRLDTRASDVAPIVRLLRRFEDDGLRGLPVGPEPSAVLANAVLAGIDRSLAGEG